MFARTDGRTCVHLYARTLCVVGITTCMYNAELVLYTNIDL